MASYFQGDRSIGLPLDEVQRIQRVLSSLVKPNPIPYQDFTTELLTLYADRHNSTRIKMRQALRELGGIIAEPSTGAITSESVDQFGQRPGRASTTNGLLASLRLALAHAEKKGYVRPGLVSESRFRIANRDEVKKKHHSVETIGKVLKSLAEKATDWKGERLLAFASIIAYCGLRPGEALRLKVSDIHDGFVFVTPHGKPLKTLGSQAPVPIPDKIVPFLERWKLRCGSEWFIPKNSRTGPWIFDRYGRRPGEMIRKAGEALGVKGFTPYSLRHSLATHFVGRLKLSTKQVQLILRHSNAFTQVAYIHPDLVNLKEMVKGFDYEARPPRAKIDRRSLPKRLYGAPRKRAFR